MTDSSWYIFGMFMLPNFGPLSKNKKWLLVTTRCCFDVISLTENVGMTFDSGRIFTLRLMCVGPVYSKSALVEVLALHWLSFGLD